MVGYRKPDGLENTVRMIASLAHEVKQEAHRRRVEAFNLLVFGTMFVALVGGETLFATMMFSIIQIEILGVVFSGAAFALMVPTVIGAAHVKVHREGDHFTKWWLKKLSSIGILIFALGVSLMVGYSAWLAAQDAVSVIAAGSIGSIGDEQVGGGASETSGLAGWIGMIPNSLLFLGLAFGMIITINFASFCLGRALEAFNILTRTPRIGAEVTGLIEDLTGKIAELRTLVDADAAAHAKLPSDIKSKFAREAANAGWKVVQVKIATARRKFSAAGDPLLEVTDDPEVSSIPSSFKSEDEFTRHLADQMDVLRMHNVLRILTGLTTEHGKEPS